VKHITRVDIVSDNRTSRIVAKGDRALERACARARNIERCNGAVQGAHEAMNYIASVEVLSRDHPRRVDVLGYSALPRTAMISCAPQSENQRRSSCQRGDSPIARPVNRVFNSRHPIS